MRISDWSSDVCSSDLTLENPGAEDFWWLNNGVTILAQEASQVGKTIKITDPQIINGLQTSTEILTFFGTIDSNDTRQVLIKIVKSTSPETRDKVIKATKSQTGDQPASLREIGRASCRERVCQCV